MPEHTVLWYRSLSLNIIIYYIWCWWLHLRHTKSSYENVIILTESSQSLIASMCIGDVFLILSFVSLLALCSSAANNPGCVCG